MNAPFYGSSSTQPTTCTMMATSHSGQWSKNRDGTVDMNDTHAVARAPASHLGHPRWNHNVDLDESDYIGMKDVRAAVRTSEKTHNTLSFILACTLY